MYIAIRMVAKKWATQGLRHGDLTALAAISKGSSPGEADRIARLERRHFIKRNGDGRTALTVAGRLALGIKRAIIR